MSHHQDFDKSDFWEGVIKQAGQSRPKVVVRSAYRPLGIFIVLGCLVFAEASRIFGNPVVALLVTILLMLIALIFS